MTINLIKSSCVEVMKDGGYSFADFAKYGGIIQAW